MGISDGSLALVLLGEPALPDAARLAERLNARCGDRYCLTWDEPAGTKANQDVAAQFFYLNDQRITVGMIPMPIPWSQLEGPCATNLFWREAGEVCRAHRAHLVVALHTEWGNPIRRSLALSDFVAALLEAMEAPAVYWGAGTVVQPAHLFCKWMAGATPDDLPLYLWVDFRLFPHDGSPFVATTGLEALGLMEIEGGSKRLRPMNLVGKVFNIAHYQAVQGLVLNDGDTIGEDEHERLRIRHTRSVWDRPGTVLRIEFDGEEKKGFLARLFGR